MKRLVIGSCSLIAFAIKLWKGFAPPVAPSVIAPGEMAGGAMNDPLSVIVGAVMTAVVVWGILSLLFWGILKIKKLIQSADG